MKKNWQDQDTMSGAEFKKTYIRLGVSQAGVGRYLGFSERTAKRIVDDTASLDRAQVLLLRAALHFGFKLKIPPWVSPRTGRAASHD